MMNQESHSAQESYFPEGSMCLLGRNLTGAHQPLVLVPIAHTEAALDLSYVIDKLNTATTGYVVSFERDLHSKSVAYLSDDGSCAGPLSAETFFDAEGTAWSIW